MQNRTRWSLVAFGILALAAGASAQYRGRDDRSYRGDYGGGRMSYKREPLDGVRTDLERAARDMFYISRGEMKRFNKVRQEIGEFQGKWARGRFDKGELDDVIGRLKHMVDKNRLQQRDRDLLMDDLGRLRGFGARSGYTGRDYRDRY